MKVRALVSCSMFVCVLAAVAAGCSMGPESPQPPESSSLASDELLASTSLSIAEARWIEAVRRDAVNHVAGTASARARTAAIATWWSLKEGVLDVTPSPYAHNLCFDGASQYQLGPLAVCNGPSWQVGLGGLQMGNIPDDQTFVDTAARLYPGEAVTAVLARVAKAARYDPATSATGRSIVASTGRLRSAWLARDLAIGITLSAPFADECAAGGPSWCYGGWDTARSFASSTAKIQQVIAELTRRFEATTGSTPDEPAAADPCVAARLGNGGYCATHFDASADRARLLTCIDGRTAATKTCPRGCQPMADGVDDICAP